MCGMTSPTQPMTPPTDTLAAHDLALDSVTAITTVDLKAGELGLLQLVKELGVPLIDFPAEELARQDVPTPSAMVEGHVGTPSVSEASVLAHGADLLVPKQRNSDATCAVGRLPVRGRLSVVGLGPGSRDLLTARAQQAIRHATYVVGYGPYVKHQRVYASIPKDEFLLEVELPRALELLAKKAQRGGAALKELGEDPDTGEPVEVRSGRYGPYVKRGSLNASLPRDLAPEDVSLEQALDILAAREAAVAASGGRKAGAKASKRKAPSKKAGAKASKGAKGTQKGAKSASRAAAPKRKATPEELARFLDQLDPTDAAVAERTLGVRGHAAMSPAEAGAELGLDAEQAQAANKRALFKLRMLFGKARKAEEAA